MHSDWVKKDLMRNKVMLSGSKVYLNENLDTDMQNLQTHVAKAKKRGYFVSYLTRKNHILVIPGKGETGIRVQNQRELVAVCAGLKALKIAAKRAKKSEGVAEDMEVEEGASDKDGSVTSDTDSDIEDINLNAPSPILGLLTSLVQWEAAQRSYAKHKSKLKGKKAKTPPKDEPVVEPEVKEGDGEDGAAIA